MAKTRDYMDYLDSEIGIAPANSQEEFQAAETIVEVMKDHGLEPTIQEFDTHPLGKLAPDILAIVLLLGVLLTGIAGGPVRVVGLLLAIAAVVLLTMNHLGNNVFENFGPVERSQNVVGVHQATGDKVTKGARPIVIVAHYDTPRENFLFGDAFARYQIPLKKYAFPCVLVAGLAGLVQIMGFLPTVLRVLVWIVGLVACMPLLLIAISNIMERFAPCTSGSNDNKASVAAMLSVLAKVRPGADRVDAAVEGKPYVRRASEEDRPATKQVVEKPVGARHGKQVIESLGILPPTCEIVYEDPQVITVPADQPIDESAYEEVVPSYDESQLAGEGAEGAEEEVQAAEPAAADASGSADGPTLDASAWQDSAVNADQWGSDTPHQVEYDQTTYGENNPEGQSASDQAGYYADESAEYGTTDVDAGYGVSDQSYAEEASYTENASQNGEEDTDAGNAAVGDEYYLDEDTAADQQAVVTGPAAESANSAFVDEPAKPEEVDKTRRRPAVSRQVAADADKTAARPANAAEGKKSKDKPSKGFFAKLKERFSHVGKPEIPRGKNKDDGGADFSEYEANYDGEDDVESWSSDATNELRTVRSADLKRRRAAARRATSPDAAGSEGTASYSDNAAEAAPAREQDEYYAAPATDQDYYQDYADDGNYADVENYASTDDYDAGAYDEGAYAEDVYEADSADYYQDDYDEGYDETSDAEDDGAREVAVEEPQPAAQDASEIASASAPAAEDASEIGSASAPADESLDETEVASSDQDEAEDVDAANAEGWETEAQASVNVEKDSSKAERGSSDSALNESVDETPWDVTPDAEANATAVASTSENDTNEADVASADGTDVSGNNANAVPEPIRLDTVDSPRSAARRRRIVNARNASAGSQAATAAPVVAGEGEGVEGATEGGSNPSRSADLLSWDQPSVEDEEYGEEYPQDGSESATSSSAEGDSEEGSKQNAYSEDYYDESVGSDVDEYVEDSNLNDSTDTYDGYADDRGDDASDGSYQDDSFDGAYDDDYSSEDFGKDLDRSYDREWEEEHGQAANEDYPEDGYYDDAYDNRMGYSDGAGREPTGGSYERSPYDTAQRDDFANEPARKSEGAVKKFFSRIKNAFSGHSKGEDAPAEREDAATSRGEYEHDKYSNEYDGYEDARDRDYSYDDDDARDSHIDAQPTDQPADSGDEYDENNGAHDGSAESVAYAGFEEVKGEDYLPSDDDALDDLDADYDFDSVGGDSYPQNEYTTDDGGGDAEARDLKSRSTYLEFDDSDDSGDILPKDTSGLDTMSDAYDNAADSSSVHRPRPKPINDPTWGKSSYEPPINTSSFARRAALYDLPDPSGKGVDSLDGDEDYYDDAEDDSYEDAEAYGESRGDDGQDNAAEPYTSADSSADDTAGMDVPNGGERMSNDDNRRRNWKGGAALRSDLRAIGSDSVNADAATETDVDSTQAGAQISDDADATANVAAQADAAEADSTAAEQTQPADSGVDVIDVNSEEELQDAILELGDDYLVAHDIWFVAVGASSVGHAGIKSFLANFRRNIRGAFLVNLDSIGAGAPVVLTNEGCDDGRRADRRSLRLFTKTAKDLHLDLQSIDYGWSDTDATPAMRARVRSITVMGMDENGLPALSHTQNDLPVNVNPGQVSSIVRTICEFIRRS